MTEAGRGRRSETVAGGGATVFCAPPVRRGAVRLSAGIVGARTVPVARLFRRDRDVLRGAPAMRQQQRLCRARDADVMSCPVSAGDHQGRCRDRGGRPAREGS